MNNIKKQFSELRKSTPKHIQWLLLIAAFVVVLILLTLLLTNKDKKEIKNVDAVAINLKINPDTINWADVVVGETKKETIKISSNAPAKILKINWGKEVNGLSTKPQENCTAMAQIDTNNPCSITVEYRPTEQMKTETVELFVDWHGVDESNIMTDSEKIMFILGAKEPIVETPLPQFSIDNQQQENLDKEEKEEPKKEIEKEINAIASSNNFFEEKTMKPVEEKVAESIDVQPVKENLTEETPAEKCSDFAFPGYNLSGIQSGWIRPEAGAYYFHPFSDKNCDTPTGVYNPDTGIIIDINDNGKKIGTDAEHIGYTSITNGAIPQLSNPVSKKTVNKARQLTTEELLAQSANMQPIEQITRIKLESNKNPTIIGSSSKNAIFSSDPFDRKFVLRQYKPIPATIVSEVRADPSLYNCSGSQCSGQNLPVRATVDRNVYSDDGRTVIIPTGTLILGYVTGELPGPYKSIGRMQIKWYQFILPNGVEFNFHDAESQPFSGDSQGRAGVPGHGSTDYVEQIVMPMLTAIVPAAVNMIAPIADTFVNQIDLDNNTVVQSGTVRSSELAKNEIITAWNQVAQKLLVDAMDNTIPPFSIAAGTRITIFSPNDLVITCGTDNNKECSVENVQKATKMEDKRNSRNDAWRSNPGVTINYNDPSWVGQVRSFDLGRYCTTDSSGIWDINKGMLEQIYNSGYEYRTILAYCQSLNYQAINNVKQDVLYQNQQDQFKTNYSPGQSINSYDTWSNSNTITGISGSETYNKEILGLTYNDDGSIQNPFQTTETETQETVVNVITCDENGTLPDEYGCCPGEIYTDMGEQGFNCCPETGGDCFPPIL